MPRIESRYFGVLVVGLGAPADVVDAVGDGEHGGAAGEDVALEPGQAAGRGVAAPAGVDEADLPGGVAEQRVVLDDLAVGPRGGDAVAEEDDGVAVADGEVGGGGRPAAFRPGAPPGSGERRRASRFRSSQARWRSTSGSSRAKSSRLGQASRAASRSARTSRGPRGQGGELAAGLGAVAVVLVVGEEPGQVAELGRRCRRRSEQRPSQSAQSVGPWASAASRSCADVGRLERLEAAGGVGVLADLVGVAHRHADCADPLVGPDRVQQALEGREACVRRASGTRRCTSSRMLPLGLSPKNWPAICFIEIRPIPAFVAGVERLVQRASPCRARGCTGA